MELTNTLPAVVSADSDISYNRRIAYLRHAPLALCVRELNRLLALESLRARWGTARKTPILDVGCGDGFWWSLQPIQNLKVYGVDLSTSEVSAARKIIHAEVADISQARPFPEISFAEIIGNCSLEHVRNISQALQILVGSAAEDARLILFVPSPDWGFQGLTQSFLLRTFPRLAMTVSGALNGFFQHWHLYGPEVWRSLLEQNGWKVEEIHGLGNARSEFLFRLFLPTGFIAFLIKILFGSYPNRLLKWVPNFLLYPFERLLAWALEVPLVSASDPKVYEYVIIARPFQTS